jgi:hypothetical protein
MTSLRCTGLLLAAFSLASCGSSNSDNTVPFVGNWTVTTGMLTGMCPMPVNTVMQKLDGGQQAITKLTDSSVSIALLPTCSIILDVTGNVASLRMTTPPQSCMVSFEGLPVMGVPVTVTFTAGHFMVTGQTASFDYSGTGTLSIISCPVTATGMSMKSAAPAAMDAGALDGP